MVKIIFYIFVSIFIAIILGLFFLILQNLWLNYLIKRKQRSKTIRVYNNFILKNVIILVLVCLLTLTFIIHRSFIYTTLYIPGSFNGDCIDLGDDTYTDESQLEFFNYMAIIKANDQVDNILFDILDEGDFPIPYETDIYTYQEIYRSRGEHKAEYLYDKNYLRFMNKYLNDSCDLVLNLHKEKIYFILGRYVEEEIEFDSYENSIYIFKAVELDSYDISKPINEQDQSMIDLLETLGYFTDTKDE
ncbi:hypothetical protein HF295_07705 [Hujiaoplasma nucleasis]|uniref:Uncharacterized protein n=1 Tax=Hujiaoplasma nucleasis TaxID=2725268 RepID=A0A7L6N5A0_9MOLU|nr:hypothetical protein [Hujiaoplasma nucleasis]QLY40741.1 hypothetical protein HF295_07705 [Hujiaoplasma nucleasis]